MKGVKEEMTEGARYGTGLSLSCARCVWFPGDRRDQVNRICEGRDEVNVAPYWVVRYAVGEYDSGMAI